MSQDAGAGPVTAQVSQHVMDGDVPCLRHRTATLDELMVLAIVGSRASGFHHDLASKLQGLMMSLDELSELGAQGNGEIARVAETAQTTLQELLALLNLNRALTRPPVRTRVALRELLSRACERVYVTLAGEVPDVTVEVAAAATIHALSLTLDVAAGPGRGRTLALRSRLEAGQLEIDLDASPLTPAGAPEALAVAAFVLARDHGELRCTGRGERMIVRLPVVSA